MRQLVRYGVVGMATNLAAYVAYLLVTFAGAEPKSAMTLVYVVGALAGFFGNRKWTFSHRGSMSGAALRYALAYLLGYVLNLLLLLVFVDRLGYPHQLVQAAAIVIVAGFLFVLSKYFVFREP